MPAQSCPLGSWNGPEAGQTLSLLDQDAGGGRRVAGAWAEGPAEAVAAGHPAVSRDRGLLSRWDPLALCGTLCPSAHPGSGLSNIFRALTPLWTARGECF